MIKNIQILEDKILSDNWYVLHKIKFEYTGKDGLKHLQERESYDRGNGAVILLYNLESKNVILTRQFRMPTFVNGNESGMMIEACAGLLDEDQPDDCIRRETEEETGYKIQDVKKVYEAYMSPGSVTEKLYFYIGEYSKSMKISDGGGAEGEDENIEVLEIPFEQSLEMIENGEIKDAKTILLIQYLRLKNIL
ncbi:MAG: GDP-mannose pyrophosphatase NudK [Bacteroidia bacterium]